MHNFALDIPSSDSAEFAALPDECRREVRARLRALRSVFSASNIGEAITEAARQLNLSPKRVRALYDDFRHSADWRSLINRSKFCPVARRLPAAFILHWRKLCETYQRKSKPAYRSLIRSWQAGESIPGYDEHPADSGNGYPEGWSYENLMRNAPSKFELAAMRDGLGAAIAAHGPQVLSTRIGLWVGSHYLVDDVTRDLKALLLGQRGQSVRIQELGALDLFSAHRFAVHRRPEFTRDDNTKDRIKEREMRFMVAAILRTTGYSKRGTEFVVEKGTAAIRKALATWLHQHFPEITVRGPGITGREQALAGYWGRGGGNPRHKAPLESHHNLLHNEASHLIAQVGHDRTEPEFLHGLECITNDVIKHLRTLPPERAALLAVPMLEYWQALGLLGEIDGFIADRTDHAIEGWEAIGNTIVEFRRDILGDDWLTPQQFLALPPAHQQMLAQAADLHPAFRRVRKLSPREAFARGANDLVTAPDHILALMFCDRDLGDDLRIQRRITANGTLEVQDATIEPGEMHFEGFVVTSNNESQRLSEREKYTVVCNPFDRDALWVFTAAGAYLGTAPRRNRVSRLDEHAIHVALGNRSHQLKDLLTPLRDRHADAAQAIADLQAHNNAVLTGGPVTPEELAYAKQRQREIRKESSNPTDFLPPSSLPGSSLVTSPLPEAPASSSFTDFMPEPAITPAPALTPGAVVDFTDDDFLPTTK